LSFDLYIKEKSSQQHPFLFVFISVFISILLLEAWKYSLLFKIFRVQIQVEKGIGLALLTTCQLLAWKLPPKK